MHGVTGILIKLGVRLIVFTAVFWFVAHKNNKIVLGTRWAAPVIGLVFAVLNTALYWVLAPVFKLASLGVLGFAMPFIVNGLLVYGTERIFASQRLVGETTKDRKTGATSTKRPRLLRIEGIVAMAILALSLTAAHGALWLALDYFPNR
ncbi:MAG TPA: hypothetical protein VLB44_13085 [Kofleriaceae bacterium]|nr:hypothetical protein [Kofleriaceae bacterium]